MFYLRLYEKMDANLNPYVHDRMDSTVAVTDKDGNILQVTGYYPSGTPYQIPDAALATEVDAKTDQLHIGNRWIGHKGLDLYDNTARMHDPLLVRFHTVVPLYIDYPGQSPWSHCAANPINFIDPDGERKWPVDNPYNNYPPRHSNDFDQDRPRGISHHMGIDINIGSTNFDEGAPVYATHDGVVVRVAPYTDGNGGGNRIKIESSDGHIGTFYMHLKSIEPNIKVGELVNEGDKIGTIGGSGLGELNHYSPHLHYEMFLDGKRINPAIDNNSLVDPQLLISPPVIILNEIVVTAVAPPKPPIRIPIHQSLPDPSLIRPN